MTNPKCWHYDPIDKKDKANCPNCHHWDAVRVRCKDHALLRKKYEESREFKALDHMMRGNRGITIS